MNIEQVVEKIATAIENITEIQAATTDRLVAIEDRIENSLMGVECLIEDIEQVQLDIQKVNEGSVLTCITELQEIVADLKQEPVGMLFTPVA